MFGRSKGATDRPVTVSLVHDARADLNSLQAMLSQEITTRIRDAGAAQAKAEAELARERTLNARADRRERMARMRRKVRK